MKTIKKSIILIFLILILSTISFAQGPLSFESVVGEAEGSSDSFNLKITAIIAGSNSITKEEVTIGDGEADSCTAGGTKTTCERVITSRTYSNPGTKPFSVSVDHEGFQASQSGELVIDFETPDLDLNCPTGDDLLKDEITVPYRIKDYACDQSIRSADCLNKCSGILNIAYWTTTTEEQEFVDINKGKNDCDYSSNIKIQKSTLTDGDNTIFIQAFDQSSQSPPNVQECNFNVDLSAPNVVFDSIKLSKHNIEFSSYSDFKVDDVIVTIEIIEEDLDTSSVKADFFPLTKQNSDRDLSGRCTKDGSTNTCSWTIDLNPEDSPSITITAADTLGNPISTSVPVQLTKDDTIEINSFDLPNVQIDGNTVYYGKPTGNEFSIFFNEHTGLHESDISLNIGGSPNECIEEDSKWKCTWNSANFNTGTFELGISENSKDILGNVLGESDKIEVVVSNDEPTIESLTINEISVDGSIVLEDDLLSGNMLEFTANVKSTIPLKEATIDLSEISSKGEETTTCDHIDGDNWECTWDDNIHANKPGTNLDIKVTVTTVSELSTSETFENNVYETSEEESLWEVDDVECTPSTLSRKIGSFTEITSDCNIFLKPRPGAESLSITLDHGVCTTEEQGALNPVKDVIISRYSKGSTEPRISVTFRQGADNFRLNELKYTCTLDIVSLYQGKVIQPPEQETFNIKYKFSEPPFGTIEESYLEKIEETKEGIKTRVERINSLKDKLATAEKLCNVFNTYQDVMKAYYVASTTEKSIACALAASGVGLPAAAAMEAAGDASCVAEQVSYVPKKGLEKTIGWTCSVLVNCDNPLYGDSVIEFFGSAPGMDRFGEINEFLLDGNDNVITDDEGNPQSNPRFIGNFLDPKRSLGMSLMTGCLPGIVNGIDKHNQIQCSKVHCLEYNLRNNRGPEMCDDLANYQTCQFVNGELLALIPYNQVWNHFRPLLQETFTNPFALASLARQATCVGTCPVPDCGASFFTCEGYKLFTGIAKIGSTVSRAFEVATDPGALFQRPEGDACDTINFEGIGEESEDE